MKQLLIQTNGNNLPWSIGYAPFLVGQQIGQNKLVVSVKCRIGSLPSPYFALLDTGAEWSVIGGEIAKILEEELGQSLDSFDMHTRFGGISGSLFRLDISLLAEENAGCDLTIESAVFVSKEWNNNLVVLGYRGFLERIRFALDSGTNNGEQIIYFGKSE